MKRRAPRRQTKGPASHVHPANHCRALIPVDGADIRKKIKKGYEKALRDLDKSRQQLDHFNHKDLPEFTRWLNTQFGALLTEIRELNLKAADDEVLVFQVHSEMMLGARSYPEAYQRIMEYREKAEQPPKGRSANREESDPFGGLPEDDDEDMRGFFDSLFDEFGSDAGQQFAGGNPAWHQPETASSFRGVSRLKELYRALVRRLHPDAQKEMTPQKSEWWHQAQAAYEARDVEQLEVILTLCEIGDNGTTEQTSASLLQRITADLKRSLREIKRELAEQRRSPAWSFSIRTDHSEMAHRMRHKLKLELEDLRLSWRRNREQIEAWKNAAKHHKSSPRRRREREQDDCPF